MGYILDVTLGVFFKNVGMTFSNANLTIGHVGEGGRAPSLPSLFTPPRKALMAVLN